MAMLNRAIFRWGNRGRRFKRGARELKGANKKLEGHGGRHGASHRRSSWTARILDAEPGNAAANSAARRASLTGGSERAAQGKGAERRPSRRISLLSLGLSWGECGAEAEAEAAARKARRHAVSRTAQMRRLRHQAQWATAWLVNFSIFFLMCWFSLTYAMLLGAKAIDEWLTLTPSPNPNPNPNLTLTLSTYPHPITKATDQWLMALLQGFWFGTAVLEPMEVAPSPSPRDYDADCLCYTTF